MFFKKLFAKFIHTCAPTTDSIMSDFISKVEQLHSVADLHEKLGELHNEVSRKFEDMADEAYAEADKARKSAERLEAVLMGEGQC